MSRPGRPRTASAGCWPSSPWVAAHDGPEIAEVCRRFEVGEKELLADLELLFLCGVHPFTPDVLIEVDVADGRVWIRMADYFRRPLRLTPPEGLALVGAGSALLGVPGADPDGALARALAKLETVLGVGADDALDVELGPVAPGLLSRGPSRGRRPAQGRDRLLLVRPGRPQPPGWCSRGGSSTPTGSGTWPGGASRPGPSGCSGSTASAGRRSWTRRSNRPPEPTATPGAGVPPRPPTTPSSCSTWTRRPTGSPSSTPTKGWPSGPTAVLRVSLRSEPAGLVGAAAVAGRSARPVVEGDATVGRRLRPPPGPISAASAGRTQA